MTQAVISTTKAEPQAIDINPEYAQHITTQDASRRYSRVTEAEIAGPREGVLATAKTPSGFVAQTITGDSIIQYRGIALTVDRAVSVGILQPDGQGGYREVSSEERTSKHQQDEEQHKQYMQDMMSPSVELSSIDPDAPELLDHLVTTAQSHGYSIEQISAELVSKRETFHTKTLPAIAQKMGINVQDLAQQLDRVGLAVLSQIKATVQGTGINADDFIEWLDQQGSRGAAAYALAFRGNFQSVKAMAAKFKDNTIPRSRSSSDKVFTIKKNGADVRVVNVRAPSGKIIQISEATAIRMGMIPA